MKSYNVCCSPRSFKFIILNNILQQILHYLFPFVTIILVIIHLTFLHEQKSSNPIGIRIATDKITFHPYFSWKDLTSLIVIIFLFMVINYLNPFSLIDPENFTPANPLVTPVHIQPE